jgi:hypothetical protein
MFRKVALMSWLEEQNKGRQIAWEQVDRVVLNAMWHLS